VKADAMREAVNINLGLLALKKCIDALNSNATYIPYQDSKLTMLLSEGLGGNCKTSVIICASMDTAHTTETVSTLRFGEKCAKIEKDVDNKSSVMEGVLRKLDEDIKRVEEVIKAKERWEVIERVRDDENAIQGTSEALRKEVVKETVLLGAEVERKELEELLMRRYEFTGRSLDELVSRTANVIGFGGKYAKAYGLGQQYDADVDGEMNIARFEDTIREEDIPRAIREQGGKDKVKRSRLVYAGLV
jgi:hypothetical protein